jgi:hypothetical protein
MSSLFSSNSVKTNKINSDQGQYLFIGDTNTLGIRIGNFSDTFGGKVVIPKVETDALVTPNIDYGFPLYIGFQTPSIRLANKTDNTVNNYAYTELSSTITSNTINFHSNAEFDILYDSRIVASGGTGVDGEGALEINATTIGLVGTTNVTGTLEASGSVTAGGVGVRTNTLDRRTSGSLSIGGNALTTAVTIQKPLTLSNPLKLGTTPTLSTELGNTTNGTINAFGTSGYTSATLTIGTAGVYLFIFTIQFTGSSGSPSFCNSVLSGAGVKSTQYGYSTINATGVTTSGTQIVTATATGYTITSTFAASITGVNSTNSYFTATRIA